MALLDNPRHERFAQGLAKGMSATEAYAAAGFKPSRSAACRLSTNVNIEKRVSELQGRIVDGVVLTKEWVIEQLIDNVAVAKAGGDLAPANKALELLGKELGMFVERKEVGKPGAFDDLTLEQKRERALALTKQLGLSRFGSTAGSA